MNDNDIFDAVTASAYGLSMGEPKYQVDQLRNAFPPDVSDDEFDDVDEFGLWFFAKSPAGVVWITPEGQEIWT